MVIKNATTGTVWPSPSSYSSSIEDIDLDSYRSQSTAELIDKTLAKEMLGLSLSWDLTTEADAEWLMEETKNNPLNLTIKIPILGHSTLTAPFRCAKRQVEMIMTDEEEDTQNTKWKVSMTLSQKKKVSGQ